MKMMEGQQCPWCYNEKFKIDFESVTQQNEKSIRRAVDSRNAGNTRNSDMMFSEETKSDGSGEGFSEFQEKQRMRASERRASIAKPLMTEAEQRLHMFDLNFENESVTMLNFEHY